MPTLAALAAGLLLASSPDAPTLDPAACAAATAVEVVDQEVTLNLTLDPPSLVGSGTLTAVARSAGELLALDARGLTIDLAEVGGVRARSVSTPDRLCVRLPATVQAGARVVLRLGWRARTDAGVPRFTPDQAWAGYDASAWMPTSRDPAQRATLRLRMIVPAGLAVAASGERGEPESAPGGAVVHRFTLSRPTPSFLYAFAVGRFQEVSLQAGGVRLRVLGPRGTDLRPVLARTERLLRFMVDTTGAPLPAREYQQVFVSGDEAQEAAGLALLGEDALAQLTGDPGDEWVFAHELAHQWFAWLVPCADFSEFWLNEGFATFLVGVEQQRTLGEAAFQREVGRWRARSAAARARGRDAPISVNPPGAKRPPPTEAELQDRGITYFRGALALQRLRVELGDEPFWRGIRRYVAAGAAAHGATSELLRRSLEAESGRDLGPLFRRWIYEAAPEL